MIPALKPIFYFLLIVSLQACKKEYVPIDESLLGSNEELETWEDLPNINVIGFTVHSTDPAELLDIYPDVYFEFGFDLSAPLGNTFSDLLPNVGSVANPLPVSFEFSTPMAIDVSQTTEWDRFYIYAYEFGGVFDMIITDEEYNDNIRFTDMVFCYQHGITNWYIKNDAIVISMQFSFN